MSSKSWSPIDTTSNIDEVRSCSFLRLGDSYWVGGFVDTAGRHYDVVETGRPGRSGETAWEVRLVSSARPALELKGPVDVAVSKGPTLELAISRALGLGSGRRGEDR